MTTEHLLTIVSRRSNRRLGRWGTLSRVLVGSGLIVMAAAVWQADWLDLVIGLVVLPTVATSLMWLRDRSAPPLRLGAAGHLVTLTHVAITASLVGEAAALFYGSMALVAGVLGNGGCEITVLANRLRDRDDRVGCPIFEPFDGLDGKLASRRPAPDEDAGRRSARSCGSCVAPGSCAAAATARW